MEIRLFHGSIRFEPALLARAIAESDALIGATADCGACTSWLIHDGAQAEKGGVPQVTIVARASNMTPGPAPVSSGCRIFSTSSSRACSPLAVNVEPDTYQIIVEPGIAVTAPRSTSRDIRRHKASNYDAGASGAARQVAGHGEYRARLPAR